MKAIGVASLTAGILILGIAVGVRLDKKRMELSFAKWTQLKVLSRAPVPKQFEKTLKESFEKKDPWKVRRAANQILFINPHHSAALYYRAWAEYELGLPDEGAGFLEAAKKISQKQFPK